MDDEIELEVSQEERRVFFVETPAEEEDVVMVNSLTDGCQVRISLEKSESFTAQIPEQERLEAVCRALTPTTAVQENAQENLSEESQAPDWNWIRKKIDFGPIKYPGGIPADYNDPDPDHEEADLIALHLPLELPEPNLGDEKSLERPLNDYVMLQDRMLERYIHPETGRLRTENLPRNQQFFHIPRRGFCQSQILQKLVKEIEEAGVYSLDTENRNLADLFVQIGSLEGTVIVCHWTDLPKEILKIIDDPDITMTQNDIIQDVNMLKKAGIIVKNRLLEAQIVWMLYIRPFKAPNSTRSGCQIQCETLGFKNTPYNYLTMKFRSNRLNDEEFKHTIGDVHVPLANLILAVHLRQEHSDNPEHFHSYMPLILEICDLNCNRILRGTSDKDKAFFKVSELEQVFLPKSQTNPDVGVSSRISSIQTVSNRLKQSKYLERLSLPDNRYATQTVNKHWGTDAEGNFITLPKSKECNLGIRFIARCLCCGDKNHSFETQEEDKTQRKIICSKRFEACRYPLCLEANVQFNKEGHLQTFDKHSILMCPTLHKVCGHCKLRGHWPLAHEKYSVRELQNIFLTHCSKGLLTCLPYLKLIGRSNDLKPYHYKLNLYSSGDGMANKIQCILGLEAVRRALTPTTAVQ